jgi:hypothetical protein
MAYVDASNSQALQSGSTTSSPTTIVFGNGYLPNYDAGLNVTPSNSAVAATGGPAIGSAGTGSGAASSPILQGAEGAMTSVSWPVIIGVAVLVLAVLGEGYLLARRSR